MAFESSHQASITINKRGRPIQDAGESYGEEDSWALSPPGAQTLAHRPQSSKELEHCPGSIVRVTMRNFVTYSSATFYPSSTLNMIIGPNGTGKSTLVCALCLGLGWGPQHLGRAKEPSEFVKHGAPEASIEIELKGLQGGRNQVIGRKIRKEGSKSTWSLNGAATNLRRVQEITSTFNIQVDNLCQFLPQDRVVEFANLRPEELLTSTLRAAGNEELIKQHEQLKDLRQTQKQQESDISHNRGMLQSLEKRQHGQVELVQRIRDRQTALEEIKRLRDTRVFAEYYQARLNTDTAKSTLNKLNDQLTALKTDAEPMTRCIDEKTVYANRIDMAATSQKNMLERAITRLNGLDEDRIRLKEQSEDLIMKRETAHKHATSKRLEIKKIERTLVYLKRMAECAPPAFKPAQFNEKTRELRRQINELNDRIESFGLEDKRQQIKECRGRIADLETEIVNLNSQAGQQELKLKNASLDAFAAWAWIQNNKDQFQGPIFGPPLVECSVTDTRFVNQLEAILQRGDFCAITCTNKDDMEKLRRQIFTTMRLADVSIRVSRKRLSEIPPPVNQVEMQRLGIEGWALDYLTGPEPVLSMLCAEQRIHATGIIPRDVSDAEFESLQASQVSSFASTNQIYTVKKRRDLGMHSTATRRIAPAKYWTEQAMDTGVERDLKLKISEIKAEVTELEAAVTQSRQRSADLKNQRDKLNDELDKIQDEKTQKQKAQVEFDMLPTKIANAQNEIQRIRSVEKNAQAEAADHDVSKANIQIKRGQCAINIANLLDFIRATYTEMIKSHIALTEARSDQKFLESQNSEIVKAIEEGRGECQKAEANHARAKEHARALRAQVFTLTESEPNLVAWWNQLPEDRQYRTPQEVDEEIGAQQARISMLNIDQPDIIQEFEERANKILELKDTITVAETGLSGIEASISTVRSQWEPRVDEIIADISSAFSEYFKHMGDSGYIEVHKAGENGRDFDDWSIGIHVKFRSDENMSILDSHRQSGGERAVTTVSYLMALQKLSRAPFRVVDEINQGMDPKNERKVHGLLVDIASHQRESTTTGSQYFLITPKLLTGLKYSDSMKIHCIVAGEHVPANTSQLDFAEILRSRKRQKIQRQDIEVRRAPAATVGT